HGRDNDDNLVALFLGRDGPPGSLVDSLRVCNTGAAKFLDDETHFSALCLPSLLGIIVMGRFASTPAPHDPSATRPRDASHPAWGGGDCGGAHCGGGRHRVSGGPFLEKGGAQPVCSWEPGRGRADY